MERDQTKSSEEHGALGCIIYSDPREDGYYQGDVYRKELLKNEYGVQRGFCNGYPGVSPVIH